MEEWKPIKSLNGAYFASSYGRIKRIHRTDKNGHFWHDKVLSASVRGNGYSYVHLSIDGHIKAYAVHRLIAECFCDKPAGCNVVNHIDSDRLNNNADNLEWTTPKGNMQHAARKGRMKGHETIRKAAKAAALSKQIPVIAIDKNGNRTRFESQTMAAQKLGIPRGHIADVCKKKYGYKAVRGYRFEYDLRGAI